MLPFWNLQMTWVKTHSSLVKQARPRQALESYQPLEVKLCERRQQPPRLTRRKVSMPQLWEPVDGQAPSFLSGLTKLHRWRDLSRSLETWKSAAGDVSQQTCCNVFVCNLATCHSDGRRIFLANPAVSLIVVGLVWILFEAQLIRLRVLYYNKLKTE